MGYTSPFTAVTGATILASQWNTSGRDNINALWIYTAAGSIAYAASATALAELLKGNAYDLLRMNAGATAPEWAGLLDYCVVSRASTLSVSADTNISWNQETDDPHNWHLNATNPQRITPGVAGVYLAWSLCHATNGDLMRVKLMLNNSSVIGAMRGGNVGGYEAWVTAISYPVALTATDYFNVLCDCNGLTGTLQTDSFFAAMSIR